MHCVLGASRIILYTYQVLALYTIYLKYIGAQREYVSWNFVCFFFKLFINVFLFFLIFSRKCVSSKHTDVKNTSNLQQNRTLSTLKCRRLNNVLVFGNVGTFFNMENRCGCLLGHYNYVLLGLGILSLNLLLFVFRLLIILIIYNLILVSILPGILLLCTTVRIEIGRFG